MPLTAMQNRFYTFLEEVARVVHMPLSSVKSRVYRALEKLRKALKEDD